LPQVVFGKPLRTVTTCGAPRWGAWCGFANNRWTLRSWCCRIRNGR